MSIDPMETLVLHFSQFMTGKLSQDEWQTVVKEFGASNIASDVKRFYRSKRFGDPDEAERTEQFLNKIRVEDEQTALRLMKRTYDMAGGAEDDELNNYPSLTALEEDDIDTGNFENFDVPTRFEPFLDIKNVPGTFYPDLIKNINRTYRMRVYDATLVLTRKLLENLLIDVLRSKYKTERLEFYYDTDSRRFKPFYQLVTNLENNLDDFKHFSSELDEDFIDGLNSFRQTANRGAHSLEIDVPDDEIEEYGKKATRTAKILFRLRELV